MEHADVERAAPMVEGFDPDGMPTMEPGAFVERLGLVFDRFTPDRLEAHLDAGPAHHQPYGIVHGGVYCTIVETLGSVAAAINAWPDGDVVVGVSNSTDFLRSHREGRLDCVAEPVHRGRLTHLWQVTITRASDGATVARGQVRLQRLPADRDLAGRPAAGPSGAQ